MTKNNVPAAVADVIAQAERMAAHASALGNDGYDGEPSAGITDGLDPEVIAFCAGLDHSDTDNAKRLQLHFGKDLVVMAQEGAEKPPYGYWTGTHWDFGNGPQGALAVAQKLGGAIALETAHIGFTDAEQAAVKAWEAAAKEFSVPVTMAIEDAATARIKAPLKRARDAQTALRKRLERRHAHAVTSKNIGRMNAALTCLAPHVLADADAFNADPLRFACKTHTISFSVKEKTEFDTADTLDPKPKGRSVKKATLKAFRGHAREDRITAIVPVAYDARATCKKWTAWLEEFSPDPQVRRMLQVASGLGLLGLAVQRLFFHYGKGANGKSVFMETIGRVLGELSITLPAESITGKQGNSGGPSPDLARLYGRRLLRVAELPQGESLRIELVKKLTGGERFPVRDLFKGYFDFTPIFVAHMSGNGYPKTDETDNGTWRRLVVVKWPKTVPTDQQRDFEDVLADFAPEYPGILNWLIEGARIFLEEGLVIAEESLAETRKYRDEMDPLAGFVSQCLAPDLDPDGVGVQASEMYSLYTLWCSENGASPISNTGFGKKLNNYQLPDGTEIVRSNDRIRTYRHVKVKYRPNGRPVDGDYPDGYGG